MVPFNGLPVGLPFSGQWPINGTGRPLNGQFCKMFNFSSISCFCLIGIFFSVCLDRLIIKFWRLKITQGHKGSQDQRICRRWHCIRLWCL